MKNKKLIVIGGGAAGIFGAITAKELQPDLSVIVLEKTSHLLNKVRVSGGGRCNTTHACFDPRQLVTFYPRGGKALLGPFHKFQPRDTIAWFEARGVELKVEEDGRMFPITDSSQTIIDCLLHEAEHLGVEIRTKQSVEAIKKEACFKLLIGTEWVECDYLLLTTGSSPLGYRFVKELGHTIADPVPSLFTFNVPTSPLLEIAGVSVEKASISLPGTAFVQTGPLLMTHWGFSGPAALKLSAWGARYLHDQKYHVDLKIDWLPDTAQPLEILKQLRNKSPQQTLASLNPFAFPKNLWKKLMEMGKIDPKKRMAELSNETLQELAHLLKGNQFKVEGKTTYKEEFVTCGGVHLDEVDFRTMESRICRVFILLARCWISTV